MSNRKTRAKGKPPAPREPVDALERFRRAGEGVHLAQREYLEAMEAARAEGRTWHEIGQAVGVTRQAAQQRHRALRAAFDAPAGSSPP